MSSAPDHDITDRIGVVIATCNRATNLLGTLEQLKTLEEHPPIVVVDNASSDGTCELVRSGHPDVHIVALKTSAGAAARNVGVEQLATPYVAFADDDSWWAEGALPKAVGLFDAHPKLGLLAARVLVGPQRTLDPTCAEMAGSPLPRKARLPGPRVLGFIACGAVIRRSSFLRVGGFHQRFGVGGEEALLSLDLSSGGWELCYVDGVVAYHHPSKSRDPAHRRRVVTRNALWTSWLRHPRRELSREMRAAVAAGMRDPAARRGIVDAVAGLPWVVRERKLVPAHVQADVRTLSRNAR